LRFYDRLEVKTILDYLRVISQPNNNDALSRVLNIPSRRIGDATIKALLNEADQTNITLWTLILDNVQGKRNAKTKLSKQTETGLGSFVDIILTARKKAGDSESPEGIVGLIKLILKKIDFEHWLEEHHGDVAKGRWANVEELITQASDFQDMIVTGHDEESLPEVDGLDQNEESDPLTRFLANVALASEVKNEEDAGNPTAQVTISTIHAAKGLEWPVVFIPAAYQGSIPHSRSEDENEERRLLYVAMTRAKALLYMSYPFKNSQQEQNALSPFLSPPSLLKSLDQKGPALQSSTVQNIALILRRPLPSLLSIGKTSELLKSCEDNLFPLGGEDKDMDDESKWHSRTGTPTFNMGQRPAHRQRIELNRSVSDDVKYQTRESRCPTTMDRSTSFTVASAEFVTARSLPVLAQQTDRRADIQNDSLFQNSVKLKEQGNRKALAEGQSTLLNFLGKPESQSLKRSQSSLQDVEFAQHPKRHNPSKDINLIRHVSTNTAHVGILPALANHRLGNGQTMMNRPKKHAISETNQKPYPFLSSSPVRCRAPEPEPEPVPQPSSLTAKPTILPLIRPVISMHRTTACMPTTTTLLQSGHAKRTLGVKRSINSGWQSRKGQGFVPPTMKRPG